MSEDWFKRDPRRRFTSHDCPSLAYQVPTERIRVRYVDPKAGPAFPGWRPEADRAEDVIANREYDWEDTPELRSGQTPPVVNVRSDWYARGSPIRKEPTMDKPTFTLAESYHKLKQIMEQATKTRLVAVDAENKRAAKAAAEIEALAVAEREATNALGRAGAARRSIDGNLPADIRQAIDRGNAEMHPHQEALDGARRALKVQQEHHEESRIKLDLKTQGGKVDMETLNLALEAAKKRVTEEEERCAKAKVGLERAQRAAAEWFEDARAAAFAVKGPPATTSTPAEPNGK